MGYFVMVDRGVFEGGGNVDGVILKDIDKWCVIFLSRHIVR